MFDIRSPVIVSCVMELIAKFVAYPVDGTFNASPYLRIV